MTRTTTSKATRPVRQGEARHWIERQLRWERTLGALRDRRTNPVPAERAA